MGRAEKICYGCGFPVRRGHVPIIWPGTATTAVYRSLDCAEAKGVQMHPRQRELHLIGEQTPYRVSK